MVGFSKREVWREVFLQDPCMNETICFPWMSIWQTKAPLRVTFFIWMVVLGKILTLDNLKNRQLIMINICCLCKLDGETVDHILLHCEVTSALWYAFFSRFWVVLLYGMVDLFSYWWTGDRSRSAMVCKMVPFCLM